MRANTNEGGLSIMKNSRYVKQETPEDFYRNIETSFRIRNKSPRRSFFYKCDKYICMNKESGAKTTAIVFTSGKVKVGDDVWRLSNSADFPEYYYCSYPDMQSASIDYEFYTVPDSNLKFFCTLSEKEDAEMNQKFSEILERKGRYKNENT